LSALVVELLCGVMLGPSVFGMLSPHFFEKVFPAVGRATQAREVVTELGLLLFVFMAGLEVQTGHMRRQGKAVLWTSLFGIAVPFALGLGLVMIWPSLWRAKSHHSQLLLAVFIATSLSISALPVIARILMDLNLVKTELGFIIMTSATVNDLIGWGLFAVILSNFGEEGQHGRNLWVSLAMVLVVFALILSLSNEKIQRAVGRLNLPRDTLLLKLTFLVVVTAAIFSQAVGTHATLGAFLAGVALARVPEARRLAYYSFHRVTAGIFATLYFVSIGMRANFVTSFDVLLVVVVVVVACLGKIGGAFLGARLGGKDPRESLIVAFGLNARGAVGIVLTTVALEYELIDQRIFVALVIMALVTSALSAVAIKNLLGHMHEEEPELLPQG
jgi:Kef-type K+ transport system membrane component KefB